MKIEDLIKQAAQLRDAVQTAVEEIEGETPHLSNAAGALHTAVTNLEGHIAAAAAKAATEKKSSEK